MESNNTTIAHKNLTGKAYWRSLDELANTPEFQERLHREFPVDATELKDPVSRRTFLQVMGASMALAWLTGCRRPVEEIIPYVQAPEDIILGVPKYYSTTMPLGTENYGVLVQSREGRPVKIEGNELHPASKGGTNSFMQAEILRMYDPDRSAKIKNDGLDSDWDSFLAAWRPLRDKFVANQGEGLAVISEQSVSPTVFRMKDEFGKQFPKAKWATYEPVSDENIYEGIRLATGKNLQPVYQFDKAKVILSLDSDFLLMETGSVANARAFTGGRRVDQVKDMNRLYVVESGFTITGSMADHRIKVPGSQIGAVLKAIVMELKDQGVILSGTESLQPNGGLPSSVEAKWVKAVVKDLLKHRGNSLVVVGRRQPVSVHAIVAVINHALGNTGNTVIYRELEDAIISSRKQFASVVKDAADGKVDTLVILGGDPVYNAPADLDFNTAIQQVPHTIHSGYYYNNTGKAAEWHLPQTHFLETWCDARSTDGTLSVVQPLIEPLFGGHSVSEILGVLTTGLDKRGYELVRATWKKYLPTLDFEAKWREVLHDGLLKTESMLADKNVRPTLNNSYVLQAQAITDSIREYPLYSQQPDPKNIELVFTADSSVYDGRYTNLGWLQELPDPVTKLMWDNAAIMSPKTAEALGVEFGDPLRHELEKRHLHASMVRIELEGRKIVMPAWILPGHADFSVTLPLGYGQNGLGRVAEGAGFDVNVLRTIKGFDIAIGAKVLPHNEVYELANAQDHGVMEGRPLVREGTLEEYLHEPHFAQEMVHVPPLESLWKEHQYDEGYQWGMTIDLNACIGCGACTVACQSENNIPIVGKKQAAYGREMHWIRLDRYFTGDVDNPQMVHQPVACQQCEMAPCEQVCPVAATVHDKEGLNVMIYNRCVGTRYCSNNCPYKVRRFNFFNYTNEYPEMVKMTQNPDVTVRSRGVMEKCTYCVQRINRGKHNAKMEERNLRDGEIITACQQVCPTEAIQFGNLLDKQSKVVQNKQNPRSYDMLAEFNTRPRTSFLAKLRNPNPDLEPVMIMKVKS